MEDTNLAAFRTWRRIGEIGYLGLVGIGGWCSMGLQVARVRGRDRCKFPQVSRGLMHILQLQEFRCVLTAALSCLHPTFGALVFLTEINGKDAPHASMDSDRGSNGTT